jgi:KRAB domain-containing zinc finger protein
MSAYSHISYSFFFHSEMQLTYQEEFVLGSTLPKEFCPGDVSKEECGRMADMCGEKPYNFIHIDERAYKCELCTKEFLKIGWLVRHKATHSAANPYICDFCNREFARKLSLKVHIRTHTGEKPYKCSVCSKIFTTCSALSRHAQVHLRAQPEENAYKCEVCSKIFTTRSALYGHTRIHSIWSIQN